MNYGELKTLVLNYGKKASSLAVGSPATTDVADFIDLAESAINRNLRAVEMEKIDRIEEADRTTYGSPANNGLYNLPSDWLETRHVWHSYGTSTVDRELQHVDHAFLRTIRTTANPTVYTITGKQIEFRGHPDSNATFTHAYYAKPADLVADTDTNDVLTAYPDLYLYGALFHLHNYVQDDEQAQKCGQIFASTIESINENAASGRGGSSSGPGYNLGVWHRGAR